jgi:hypothetical protein
MELLHRVNESPGAAFRDLSYGGSASYIEPDVSCSVSVTQLGFIKLEISTAVPEPPAGGWIHEIKYDGTAL